MMNNIGTANCPITKKSIALDNVPLELAIFEVLEANAKAKAYHRTLVLRGLMPLRDAAARLSGRVFVADIGDLPSDGSNGSPAGLRVEP